MGYLKETVKNFGWVGGFRISTRVVAFARTAILARMLTPSQFGIYGIVLISVALLELLTETGINIFLIQEDEDVDTYVNTAWVVSILRGTLVAILIFTLAPLVAGFFNSSDAVSLLYVVSLVPLVRGFINPSIIKFQKNLQFSKDFWFRTSVFIIDSSVAITLAFLLRSPISLVLGLLSGAIFEVILSYLFAKPWPKFKFELRKARRVISRGKWITFAGVFDYLAKQGDNMVVGKLLGTAQLGLYQMAYTFSTLPVTEVSDVAGKVTFPVYTRIGGDRIRLKRAYLISLFGVTILALPLALALIIYPEEVIKIVLGPNWLDAVRPLQILSIFGLVRAVSGTSSAIFLGIKMQKIVTFVTFIRFFTLALLVFPLTIMYGIYGTAIAALISSIVPLPFIIYNLAKVFR